MNFTEYIPSTQVERQTDNVRLARTRDFGRGIRRLHPSCFPGRVAAADLPLLPGTSPASPAPRFARASQNKNVNFSTTATLALLHERVATSYVARTVANGLEEEAQDMSEKRR